MMRKMLILVCSLLTIALFIVIIVLKDLMAPVKLGTVEEFWYVACGVNIDGQERVKYIGEREDVAIGEKEYFYERSHLHGSYVYAVNRQKADRCFNEVKSLLEEQSKGEDEKSAYVQGYINWKNKEDNRLDVENLFQEISDCLGDEYEVGFHHYILDKRVKQSKWYWANFTFEFLFFSGLIWFAFLPIICKKRPWRIALHLGLVPNLFMLPFYLGYCYYTCTSAGPKGGILYPWLLVWLDGWYMCSLDHWILEWVPKLLEPLSHDIGIWTALSGRWAWGPIEVLGIGFIIAVLVFGICLLIQRKKHIVSSDR